MQRLLGAGLLVTGAAVLCGSLAKAQAPAQAQAPAPVPGDEEEHPPPRPPLPARPTPFVRQKVPLKNGMLRIPGGKFSMGSSDKAAPANERPARIVVVPPFWIDRTEVTVGAYRACVERGACRRPPRTSTLCTYDMGDPELPVSCVPWGAARAYCVAARKRLPREIEWEFSARGTHAINYPWGGSSPSCAGAVTLVHNQTQRSCSDGERPAKVGTHPGGASPFGVLDMSGNVEEWVSDWYAARVSDLSPRAGGSHVLRGGGWMSPPSLSRTTSRSWGSVREAGPNVGFRCARDDA
jgi:formylglycine-generating enzyme required for sulfatase activity